MPIEQPEMPSGGPVRTTDLGEITLDELREVLEDGLARLDDAGIPFAIMGGLAVTTLARPRWTHDIDVFLRPRDAAHALTVLGEAGYDVERVDHEWLFKAHRGPLTIDLIFRSTGNLYFDEEVEARRLERTFLGVGMPVVSPEDLLVIKAAADTELNHYHWFDALSLMINHHLDWEYVLRRARASQRHLLSLLIYADAADIDVPSWVIRQLAARVYGTDRPEAPTGSQAPARGERPSVVEEELRQRLRADPRIADLDIGVAVAGETLVVTGEVQTAQRQREITECAAEVLPEWQVRNRVRVREADGRPRVEVVS